MKKTIRFFALALVLLLCVPLFACGKEQLFTRDFFDTFDTYVQITAYAADQESFDAFYQDVYLRMQAMHKLFDIYNEYEGINNAATVNRMAGEGPVAVDPLLVELVLRCKDANSLTQGAVNIALGPVLSLWHACRIEAIADPSGARLPDTAALEQAAQLCDLRDVVADAEAGTLFLRKAGMSLDLGAVGKGYAVEVAARDADKHGIRDYLISAGGNVLSYATPDGPAQGSWNVGVLDPDLAGEGGLLDVLSMKEGCAVTSGDYQRNFELDGVRYGHIIDPWTLSPARGIRSVTVIGPSSLDADILSTALFVLPYERGRALVADTAYDAIWVLEDGRVAATEGARNIMRERSGEQWL